MDGNRHKATAQLMPSGRKQDWGDQPLFDQSDLYVIPEALIYEILVLTKSTDKNKNNSIAWRPGPLGNKDCDSMDGNRHKATAQQMSSGNEKDWGDQPLFDQSDLYVIPEALIYEIFFGILSSTPSFND